MLVGRESEQLVVERLLAGARVGNSGVLVISGDPGIGKTALLAHARAAAQGMRQLSAQGVEAEHEIAFSGLHQLCTPLLDLVGDLPAAQQEALGVALGVRSGATPERFAAGAALLGLLSRAAEDGPLAVFVDDAHLLDQSSTQALAFAARRLVTDAVVILVAQREEPDSGLVGLTRLRLGPLDLEATRTLVQPVPAQRWPDAALARFHEATGGNPLAVLELGAEAGRLSAAPPAAPVPLTGELLAAFSRRVLALSQPARAVLLLAATDSHDLAALSRACDTRGLRLSDLAEAESAGLVRVGDGTVEFRHPLVRAAVYGSAEPAARREAHLLMATSVARGEQDRRAWHRSEAAFGPDDEAASLLMEAAERSALRGANAVASAQWERAAALTADASLRSDALLRAGEQGWLSGSKDRATDLLGRSLDLAETPLARARATDRLAAIEARCGSVARARDLLLATADLAAADDHIDLATDALADAVEASFYLCDPASALAAGERLRALLADTRLDPESRRLGRLAAGVAHVLGGEGDLGARFIRDGLAEAGAEAAHADQWRLRWRLLGPIFLRETGATRATLAQAVQEVRARAAVGVLPFLLMLIAKDDAASTDWEAADEGYAEAVRLARETGHDADLALALAGWSWLEARRGLQESALGHADEAARLGASHDARLASVWASWARADLASTLGNTAEAAACYAAVAEQLADLGVTDPDLSPAPELVECLSQAGEIGRAREVADAFVVSASRKGQPWAMARSHRALGIVGGPDEAQEHFVEALALHARTTDTYESARTQLALGARLRRDRRRADARPALRQALRAFEQLGAAPWADRAAAELRATGETAVRRGAGVLTGLTPQERQIAGLLASGRTTRETAMTLFLSPKTVEYHLRHVYIKLGIRSRQELARALASG